MAPIAQVLLDHGASVRDVDVEERTPLHVAAMAGNLEVSAAGYGIWGR